MQYKHYDKTNTELGVDGYCFIDKNYIAVGNQDIQGPKIFEIIKLETDKVIYKTSIIGGYPEYNKNFNSIIVGFGNIYSFDLNKIMTTVKDDSKNQKITTTYTNNILSIDNLLLESPNPKITISDINGKIIRQLNLPLSNGVIRIPIKLICGTYFIDITDGKKQYSSKFIVVN